MMAQEASTQTGRVRTTRGAFPRTPLREVEDLVRVIHEVGQGEPARLITVLDKLNRTATSSATRTLLTSAGRGYGLVSGNTSDTHLTLTERGLAFATAKNELARHTIAYAALQHNEVFRAFVDKFKHRPMPSDEVAIDYIKGAMGFSEKDAAVAVRVIQQNAADYGLIEVVSGRDILTPPDEALEALRTKHMSEQPLDVGGEFQGSEPNGRVAETRTVSHGPIDTRDIVPQIAFNIQVQLPSDASPETYEAIFRNIAKHLLQRDCGADDDR